MHYTQITAIDSGNHVGISIIKFDVDYGKANVWALANRHHPQAWSELEMS